MISLKEIHAYISIWERLRNGSLGRNKRNTYLLKRRVHLYVAYLFLQIIFIFETTQLIEHNIDINLT